MKQIIKVSIKFAQIFAKLQIKFFTLITNVFFTKKIKSMDEIEKIRKSNPSKAGYMFEMFILDHFKKIGYTGDLATNRKNQYPKELQNTKGDGGLDVILENENEIILIQTKLYSSKVKKEVVSVTRDVSDIFKKHFFEKGDRRTVHTYIITNNDFDNTAYAFAKHCSVKLINGDKLNKILNQIA